MEIDAWIGVTQAGIGQVLKPIAELDSILGPEAKTDARMRAERESNIEVLVPQLRVGQQMYAHRALDEGGDPQGLSRRQQITFTSSMLLRSIGAWMTKRGLPESSNCFVA